MNVSPAIGLSFILLSKPCLSPTDFIVSYLEKPIITSVGGKFFLKRFPVMERLPVKLTKLYPCISVVAMNIEYRMEHI